MWLGETYQEWKNPIDSDVYFTKDPGEPRKVNHLAIFWPLLSRSGYVWTKTTSYFI